MVWSAFRLVKAAKEAGAKLAIVNVGPTRADDMADLKVCVHLLCLHHDLSVSTLNFLMCSFVLLSYVDEVPTQQQQSFAL